MGIVSRKEATQASGRVKRLLFEYREGAIACEEQGAAEDYGRSRPGRSTCWKRALPRWAGSLIAELCDVRTDVAGKKPEEVGTNISAA